jgi:ABC-2 type transport system permease protein
VTGHLTQVAALARRDAAIEVSYHFRLLLRVIGIFFAAATLFFLAELVHAPSELGKYSGDYFDYALIGLAVVSMATVGLGAFNATLAQEQSQGTLEILLSTPVRAGTLLAGTFVVPLAIATVQVVLLVGIGIGFVGVGFSPGGIALSLPVLALTLLTFAAIGIVSAGLVILVKRGDPITAPLAQLTAFFAGAIFPVTLLPGPLEVVAHCFPAYYAIEGLRDALLTDGGADAVRGDVLVLTIFAAILVPSSLWLFSRALRAARATGTLGTY